MIDHIKNQKSWPSVDENRFEMSGCPNLADHFLLSLWLLISAEDTLCLYGWAVPTQATFERKWNQYEVMKLGASPLRRVTFHSSYEEVTRILSALYLGSSLSEVALTEKCPLPERADYAGFSLGTSEQVKARYAATPWTFFPKVGTRGIEPSYARSRRSPNPQAPAVGTSLILRNKDALVDRVGDKSLEAVLRALEDDTSFEFTKADLARLGDIELFTFPAAHQDERPKVRTHFKPHPVLEIELSEGVDITVRCAQRSGGLILADETRQVRTGAGTTRIEFAATPDGPHATTIQIWTGSGDETLWYEDQLFPVRRIGMTMRLLGTTIELNSDWLTRWAAHGSHKDAAARMKRVQRTSTDHVSTIGEPDADFVSAARDANTWATLNRPESSGARFFPKGDKLEFATWLREQMSDRTDVAAMVLFDPYLDQWGLEMIARTENSSCAFEVVTCLIRPPASQEDVCARLEAAISGLSVALLGLRLRVLAFGGTERPFHDRVLFSYDHTGTISKGFHLSNSLDSAAKNYALLVTPIPSDVLRAVGSDFARVLREEGEQRVLYDHSQQNRPPSPNVPVAPLSDESLDSAILRFRTATAKDIGTSWTALVACVVQPDSQKDFRDTLGEVVNDATAVVWSHLGQWLTGDALAAGTWNDLAPVNVRRSALAILTPYRSDFPSAMESATYIVEHYHETTHVPRAIGLALEFMLEYAPEEFVESVDRLANGRNEGDSAKSNVADASLGGILVAATNHISDSFGFKPPPRAVSAFLKARTPFLRALAAASLGQAIAFSREEMRISVTEALEPLELLTTTERLVALGTWIGDFRVGANRAGRENPLDGDIRRKLMEQMVEWWPSSTPLNFLGEIVRRAEGPIPGGWAADTTNDFLLPLEATKKVGGDAVRNVWLDILKERLLTTTDGRVTFYSNSDGPLTQVAAQLLARDGKPEELELLELAAKRARRALTAPFGRAHYQRFARAREQALWIEAFARLIEQAAATSSDIAHSARKLIDILKPVGAEARYSDREDPGGLLDFASAVGRQGE